MKRAENSVKINYIIKIIKIRTKRVKYIHSQ